MIHELLFVYFSQSLQKLREACLVYLSAYLLLNFGALAPKYFFLQKPSLIP